MRISKPSPPHALFILWLLISYVFFTSKSSNLFSRKETPPLVIDLKELFVRMAHVKGMARFFREGGGGIFLAFMAFRVNFLSILVAISL